LAFLALEFSRIAKPYQTILSYASSQIANSDEIPMTSEPVSLTLNSDLSMTKKYYYALLFMGFVSSIILFGVLPSIGTYAVLPYSQRVYYISSIILPIANPLSVLLGLFMRSILKFLILFILFIFAICLSVYVTIVAFLSPCPPLHDSTGGGVLIISCYFLAYLSFYYVRLVIGNRIRQEYQRESGLFWLGATSQMGSLVGAIPMFLLVNTYNVFKSRNVCQAYCLD
jgi:riboflavin transporter 2